jgi:SAM-dependent methyltransferase
MPSNPSPPATPIIGDELELLVALVPLQAARLIEPGCGNARMARALLERRPHCEVVGLEVDEVQHAKNLAAPQPGLSFVKGVAQSIPFEDGWFDGALMLKSLHHVPMPLMGRALGDVARVLRPGGWLYVSEPVYAGSLNDLIRLFNDEREVRAAAQAALDDALRSGAWEPLAEHWFEVPARFRSFAEFEQQAMRQTFANHSVDDALLATVRARFEPHLGPDGAAFTRPMHVRVLRTTR